MPILICSTSLFSHMLFRNLGNDPIKKMFTNLLDSLNILCLIQIDLKNVIEYETEAKR